MSLGMLLPFADPFLGRAPSDLWLVPTPGFLSLTPSRSGIGCLKKVRVTNKGGNIAGEISASLLTLDSQNLGVFRHTHKMQDRMDVAEAVGRRPALQCWHLKYQNLP